jgi:hypothetical protein
VEIRTSRTKAGAIAVACAVLVALSAWQAQTAGAAWIGVAVFGLGFSVAVLRAALPTTVIRLDDQSLAVTGVRQRAPIPWSDIEGVEIGSRGAFRGSFVAVTVRGGAQGARRLELTDTWLDHTADAIAGEITRRANAVS